ncbi:MULTISPECIES: ComEA family DNA-binding protein [Shewanella]|uniref:ComEA family DNA-binding protein n=1 Tax=Shewanella metallivivens TaxID=2872342 RepID=A0ABT5TKM1_9GAMM|nr:ComEA family DNA-binding protein [Shewanella metallivivens]MDD8059142.1 ComEA family DNA-binding protein [Shewanella metallivivens]
MKSSLTLTAVFMCLCCFFSTSSFAADSTKTKTVAEVSQKSTKAVEKSSTKVQSINVNKANVTELQSLKGIGKAKAQAIVDYRTKNGKFKNLQQLTMVKGVGEKLVSQNAKTISF